MIQKLFIVAAALMLVACGGGGGSYNPSSTGSTSAGGAAPTPAPTPMATNTAVVTVDAGPAGLNSGPNGYIGTNFPYVTVTVCAPGSATNCQVIDHVEVDTGSVGLRILAPVLNSSLLAALPMQLDTQGNPVGECFGFVDSYMFGSVRSADVSVGGEKVAAMPFQAVADTGAFATVPSQCSSGAGTNLNSVNAAGENGILGVGVTTTDCGNLCQTPGGYSAAIYYDCPSSGCGAIISRASSAQAPFQQLPNFAAALGVDNNGIMISLPMPDPAGSISVTGTLYFGIDTQTNNSLGNATVLTATPSSSNLGAGFITVVYNGNALPDSYIDSGTNLYLFTTSTIADCGGQNAGYYCPTSDVSVNATLQGGSGSAPVVLTVENAATLLATNNSALPGLAGDPQQFPGGGLTTLSNSFALGLPFFFGRNVYFGIEGTTAGAATGPFFAF